jgi:hypothetical protein
MPGGGEPARDAEMDADMMDAVSLIISLAGVSGLCETDTAREAVDGPTEAGD